MAIEIERKYLVAGPFKHMASSWQEIVQGYLCSDPERAVRVRIIGQKAYLTIKGIADASGVSRYEWEKEIEVNEARELMLLCEPGVIDKVRYYIREGMHTFEVDEFRGENQGLIIAEIELEDKDQTFGCPPWLGKEVTGDARYYNVALSKQPYTKW